MAAIGTGWWFREGLLLDKGNKVPTLSLLRNSRITNKAKLEAGVRSRR